MKIWITREKIDGQLVDEIEIWAEKPYYCDWNKSWVGDYDGLFTMCPKYVRKLGLPVPSKGKANTLIVCIDLKTPLKWKKEDA